MPLKHEYELWQRYGKVQKISHLIFTLSDDEVKELTEYLDDPVEFRRVDGADMSYLWERV